MGNVITSAKGLTRTGFVTSIDPVKVTARVEFPDWVMDDGESVVSYDLQVVQDRAYGDQSYWMPDIGEQVRVTFQGNGIETGFIERAVYSEKHPPPVTDPNKRHVRYKDGAWFEYDRKIHTFEIRISGEPLQDGEEQGGQSGGAAGGEKGGKVIVYIEETYDTFAKGTITVKTEADILVEAEGKIDVIAKRDVSVKSDAKVNVTAKDDVTVKTEASATVQAEKDITLKASGNITLNSNGNIELKAGGNVSVKGTFVDLN